jgi:hypothetical protein
MKATIDMLRTEIANAGATYRHNDARCEALNEAIWELHEKHSILAVECREVLEYAIHLVNSPQLEDEFYDAFGFYPPEVAS